LFESPTGTVFEFDKGKSLSLICGSFKWLKDYRNEVENRFVEMKMKEYLETMPENPKGVSELT
jgi:hypothetical protein